MKELTCPDCGSTAVLKDSAIIYGRSYGPVWICPRFPTCQCFVGCHKGSEVALGTLANGPTRSWRKAAHSVFDLIWQKGPSSRGQAYAALAQHLGVDKIHIGESDAATCRRIVEYAKARVVR